MSDIENGQGFVPLIPGDGDNDDKKKKRFFDENYQGFNTSLPEKNDKKHKPFYWEKDPSFYNLKNDLETNDTFKIGLFTIIPRPNEIIIPPFPELRNLEDKAFIIERNPLIFDGNFGNGIQLSPGFFSDHNSQNRLKTSSFPEIHYPTFEQASQEFKAAQEAFDAICTRYIKDTELAEILASTNDRGFDSNSVNLVVSMNAEDRVNVDLVLMNAAHTPTEEETEIDERIAKMTQNLRQEEVEKLEQARERLSAARSLLFQLASVQRMSQDTNPRDLILDKPDIYIRLLNHFTLDKDRHDKPIKFFKFNLKNINNAYLDQDMDTKLRLLHLLDQRNAAMTEQEQLKNLKEMAHHLGLTRENIHELHGQMLLTSGLPLEVVDQIFVRFYQALDYYDGSVPFDWPANYRKDYQPGTDSAETHPEDRE